MVVTAIAVAAGALVRARRFAASCSSLRRRRVACGVVARRPLLLIVGVARRGLGARRALVGRVAPAARRAVVDDQWVTLLTDPAPFPGGSVGADVRIGVATRQAFARGPAAGAMAAHLAGERLRVSGVLRPLTGVQRARQAPRHIAARLSIDDVSGAGARQRVGDERQRVSPRWSPTARPRCPTTCGRCSVAWCWATTAVSRRNFKTRSGPRG